MPRNRNDVSDSNTADEATNETQGEMKKMANALDAATIAQLLSKQKSRGDYDAELADFLKSGIAGIEVSLTEGRFTNKKAAQVSVGFNKAKKRTTEAGALVHEGAQNVKVISLKGEDETEHVYLINTAVSAEAA